jgi:branched-chain amino acid transport system ATP-binding protein
MSGAALEVEELRVTYATLQAVRGISLRVGAGEAVAVIGSNGAGKTSLLRGIMGLAPRSGRIDFCGRSIAALRTQRIRRAGIGYVPEGRELFPGLSVKEELLIGGRLLDRAAQARKLDEMYAMFPRLHERQAQITRTLSGGEQQMVAIARVLMGNPGLLLLDEPSLGLAPVIQDAVYAALATLRTEAGMPMLLVEQNAHRALGLCSRAYVLELGMIIREGNSDVLRDDPAMQAAYLGH